MAEIIAEATRIVNLPSAQVWALVAAYGCEALWHTTVKTSSLSGFGIGSIRTLKFHENTSAWVDTVREKLVIADAEKLHIRWQVFNDIVGGGGEEIYSGIELKEVEGKTEVRWYALGVPLVDEEARGSMRAFVEGMYVANIKSLEEKLGAA